MTSPGPPRKRQRSKVTKLVAHEPYIDHSDKDVAWVEDELIQLYQKSAKKSWGGPKVSFPFILYDMLDKVETSDRSSIVRSSIVSWLPHGRAFMVHNPKEFQATVLPKYFRQQSSYASFQRQLNIYGFRRLTGPHRDHNAYYHELFLRTRKHLCALMVRCHSSALGPVRCAFDASTEPNFYSMTPMPQTSAGTTGSCTNDVSNAIQDSTMRATEQINDRPVFGSARLACEKVTLDTSTSNSIPTANRPSRFPLAAELERLGDQQIVPPPLEAAATGMLSLESPSNADAIYQPSQPNRNASGPLAQSRRPVSTFQSTSSHVPSQSTQQLPSFQTHALTQHIPLFVAPLRPVIDVYDHDPSYAHSYTQPIDMTSQDWYSGNGPAFVPSMRERVSFLNGGIASNTPARSLGLYHPVEAAGTIGRYARNSLLGGNSTYNATLASSALVMEASTTPLEYADMLHGLLTRPLTLQMAHTVPAPPHLDNTVVPREFGLTSATAPFHRQLPTAAVSNTHFTPISQDDIDSEANALVQAVHQSVQRAEVAIMATAAASAMSTRVHPIEKMPLGATTELSFPLATASTTTHNSSSGHAAVSQRHDRCKRRRSSALSSSLPQMDLFDDQSILSHDGSSLSQSCGSTS